MSGSFNGNGFRVVGRPEPAPGAFPSAETRAVTAGALAALGITVERGRGIAETDREGAPLVIVINEAMVALHWPGEDPIGQRIVHMGETREIVGVVRDVREFTPDRAPEPGLYLPHEQAPEWVRTNPQNVVVRTAGDPLAVAGAVRSVVADVEPRAAIGTPRPMQEVVDATLAAPRFRTVLLGIFAAVALLLAIVGIYGVVSRAVAQRRHEVGIRMSLGARRGDVLSMLLGDGLRPVLLGVAIGLAGGFMLARTLSGLLFGVGALDPLTFLAAPAALTLAAAAACLLPARGASRTDPATVLRMD
jgi:predicted permease